MADPHPQVVQALLDAYRAGIFPMADPDTGRIDWYSPDPRAILPLSEDSTAGAPAFHISRSLDRRVRSGRFTITSDAAFEAVIRSCGEPRPERPDSWIDERIVAAYTAVHRAGHAHSVEAWLPASPIDLEARRAGADRDVSPFLDESGSRVLVGGVYGVSIGAVFFAESMFCRPELGVATDADGAPIPLPGTDASKVCLVHLVRHLRARGFALMDVQFQNSHIRQFGVRAIRRAAYLKQLAEAVARETRWEPFESEQYRHA